MLLTNPEGFKTVFGVEHIEVMLCQPGAKNLPHFGFIVDDQNCLRFAFDVFVVFQCTSLLRTANFLIIAVFRDVAQKITRFEDPKNARGYQTSDRKLAI